MNQDIAEYRLRTGQLLQLVEGDLTEEAVDAIVNAANAQLEHGAGVAGAIVRGGGPQIQAESRAWVREHGPVSHEEPAYTGAGDLPSRIVIHAVGPVWGSGGEDEKLSAAVLGSLKLAGRLDLRSIAFPALSTGIFGFPKERAARILFSAVEDYFLKNPQSSLERVRFVLYDRPTLDAFRRVWVQRGYGSVE